MHKKAKYHPKKKLKGHVSYSDIYNFFYNITCSGKK